MKRINLILIASFLILTLFSSSAFARAVWVKGRLGEDGKMTRGYYKSSDRVESQYSKPKYSLYSSGYAASY